MVFLDFASEKPPEALELIGEAEFILSGYLVADAYVPPEGGRLNGKPAVVIEFLLLDE